MKTTHLSIYTLRDLRLQGMVSAHSHEEVRMPLNPVQFTETCVTADMVGWSCQPRHMFHLCIPVTLSVDGNTENILPGEG